MSKKSKQTGAETGDDVSSLFAKLGSSGATAYQDFSADRLSAAEPAAATPPPAPAAPAPVLSVVRAAIEARPAALSPAAPLPLTPAAPAPAAAAGAATGTPLQQLFQRLLEAGREAAVPAPGGPLKRFLNR
ncbi:MULTISPECIES: hypothetical protein [Xanthomonas]|uniref:Uncharacterized protein n=1 Tax=Xanthomonas rydalmerensis TaxID=3046274 RepID=A0ABZ0JKD7_9XANT|nr:MULTISPECIES: hypothetical protein [unclassified Xanthomonas]MBB5877085.1 pyruvate/2-oxoglutarate dehydrogenase complex dihydrolipoamide acyltransferase (E2) component [Xanthomonas sp. 3498]WOS40241.1 hypothetical protein QN243_17875 [Xanthomonas sp. DM-2023]WOS44425.1 hypothetical protein QN242_17875 [Xanthomonas sp. DM-2023]WOS48605.1 hypothetical protein QN240_17875 [Xanthomonas sp. DM-2023]WOS52785.1 hypothetical protein QN244_17880 [Xanthomonas sp. DM-2023]